jgi:two-component system, cell cycle response regulator
VSITWDHGAGTNGQMAGKVLIVDDAATNRIVLRVKLSAAFYLALSASDGASALALARAHRPDLVLISSSLTKPGAEELVRLLAADPVTCATPVLALLPADADRQRRDLLAAGAADVLAPGVPDTTLLARIRNLIRARSALPETPAETSCLAEAGAAFVPSGRRVRVLFRDRQSDGVPAALAALPSLMPEAALSGDGPDLPADLYVLDASDGDAGAAIRFISELRTGAATRYAAICLRLTSPDSDAALAFDLGAEDVLAADLDPAELAVRLNRLVAAKLGADARRARVEDRLRDALIDPLTGLYNRRYALPQFAQIAERAEADGRGFAAFVIDIDRFKAVNDRFGHAAGDRVLTEVARRLSSDLRAGDLIARIGGEEFLAVLPDIALPDARRIAERLRGRVSATPIAIDGADVSVTVSIGLAMGPQGVGDVDRLIDDADLAMLAAKSAGRNQVTVSRPAA